MSMRMLPARPIEPDIANRAGEIHSHTVSANLNMGPARPHPLSSTPSKRKRCSRDYAPIHM